jgi:hypothetical protein
VNKKFNSCVFVLCGEVGSVGDDGVCEDRLSLDGCF